MQIFLETLWEKEAMGPGLKDAKADGWYTLPSGKLT